MKRALGELRNAVYDLNTDHRTWLSRMAELYRPFFPSASRIALLDVRIHKDGASLMDAGPADPAVRMFMRAATKSMPKRQVHFVMRMTSVVGSFSEWVAPLGVPNFWSTFTMGGFRLCMCGAHRRQPAATGIYKKLGVANRNELVRALVSSSPP